jgi:predicted DNA repair protein MutK
VTLALLAPEALLAQWARTAPVVFKVSVAILGLKGCRVKLAQLGLQVKMVKTDCLV